VRPRLLSLALLVVMAGLIALAAACGDEDGDSEGGVELSLESCDELEYEGEGEPDALIVTDLPMQGDSAERSAQQAEAVRLALEQRDWRAGDTAVAFQACDDSIAETGLWDAATCRGNAEAYAAADQLLGVIGTYNSGCAEEEIPILNEAGIAMISPGNTAVCLTQPSSTCEGGQPASLYPGGQRNYLRVVPNDAFQGAGLAELARTQGIERPFVLYARDDPTSTGQATNFRSAARELGTEVVGYESWDPEAKRYAGLMAQVRRSGADGVVLAGLIEQNGARLIRDKVAALGSNQKVPLLAFDGFSQQSTIDQAGPAAIGMLASVPGRAAPNLPHAGQLFVAELEGRVGDQPVEHFAPYAGEAADVLLDAIAEAGADRTGLVGALFDTPRTDGLLGEYEFQGSGDPSVGPVTILEAREAFTTLHEIIPAPAVVAAARR
jgi:branched-chain amino acid transport system substrate-binding protein